MRPLTLGGGVSASQLDRELLDELAGTFLFMLLGLGSDMAAAFCGFSLDAPVRWMMAVSIAASAIPKAHMNPAISLAFCVTRREKSQWKQLFPRAMAQLGGSIAATAVNYGLFAPRIAEFEASHDIVRSSEDAVASASAFGDYFDVSLLTSVEAFGAEVIGAFALGTVVFSLTHPSLRANKNFKHQLVVPILIGLTVAVLISVLGPLTGAGLNPARDLGPRLVTYYAGWSGNVAFQHAWLYAIAPLVGAPLGALFVDNVLYTDGQTDAVDDTMPVPSS